jgi:hypothetical protein
MGDVVKRFFCAGLSRAETAKRMDVPEEMLDGILNND